ncbi:MAG: acetolactate synthase small subunit [Ktedonobacteraceae bacterium]|nr:acetolactate synthase small subunit [Ktedonobacteraceae bacterium]
MTNPTSIATRAGTTNAAEGTERIYTLVALVEDRPGAIDRVVGALRRRRAKMQSLTISQCETPNRVRIIALVKDSEVVVEQVIEQLRKIVDVRQVMNVTDQQAVVRELALITVDAKSASLRTLIEVGHQFGASIADVTDDSVILESTGNVEQLERLIDALRVFGIREIARSGCVASVSTNEGK